MGVTVKTIETKQWLRNIMKYTIFISISTVIKDLSDCPIHQRLWTTEQYPKYVYHNWSLSHPGHSAVNTSEPWHLLWKSSGFVVYLLW